MTALQLPMDEIEHWRNKALLFSRSDQLGHLLVNSFDLMRSVLVSGLHSQTLPLKIKVLSMECATALAAEPIQNDESRSLNYGFTSSICALLNCLSDAALFAASSGVKDQQPNEARPQYVSQEPQTNTVTNGAVEMGSVTKEEPCERFQLDVSQELQVKAQEAPIPFRPATSPLVQPAPINEAVGRAHAAKEEEVIIIKDEIMEVAEAVAIELPTQASANDESGFVEHTGEEDISMDESGQLMEALGETLEDSMEKSAEESLEQSANLVANLMVINSPGISKSRHSRLSTLKKKKGEDAKRRASAPSKFSPGPEEVALKKAKRKSSTTKEDKGKSHQCSSCDSSFVSVSKLTRHMIKHTGEKPFTCDQCGQRFTEKWSMTKHLRRSHNVKPNKCSDCEESFEMYGDLVEHKKTAHK